MRNRSYSARRITATEKPGRLSGFSSLQPCGSQPEQNETDEPPSLFNTLTACGGQPRMSGINSSSYIFFNSGTSFLSKTDMLAVWNFFFADTPDKEKMEPVPRGNSPSRLAANSGEILRHDGFILRDRSGRIKTVIFGKKRSR